MNKQNTFLPGAFGKKGLLLLLMLLLCTGVSLPAFPAQTFASSASAAPSLEKGFSIADVPSASGGKFVKKNKNWYYQFSNKAYAKNGLLNIRGKIYYFSPKGVRLYGWQKINGQSYYFGKKKQGYLWKNKQIQKDEETYYFVKEDGRMVTGYFPYHGKHFFFDEDGVRLHGWHKIQGTYYYLGTPKQGYIQKNMVAPKKKQFYYVKEDGTLLTSGWATYQGQDYYFGSNGRAYKGTHTIDDIEYTFDKKGRLISVDAGLPSIKSDCALLMDMDSGQILYSKNPNMTHANASTTKIMTCILALEHADLNDVVTASANAAAQEPTKLYLSRGETFYMKDLLYSLMIPSHNDSAVAIAEHISGSTKKFAKLMNKKAKRLGCTNTHFVTPNGLDNGVSHYTTASDMAKIARYAWKNPVFRQIVGTSSYTFQSINKGVTYRLSTTNRLLNSLPGVCGMKTGFTNKAGHCFVGAVTSQSGKTYLSVILGGPTSDTRWKDSKKLLKFAYRH